MNSYGKLCTEYYDIDKPHAPPDALAFYLRYAEQAESPILEPMCGSGRFLIPLLERGFDVDGTDASPSMLRACRDRCQKLGLAPTLHEQLLHELDLPRQYGLVLIPAGSLCLLTDPDEVHESLRRIRAHMRPGATFVLEIEQLQERESGSEPWGGSWVERPDGARIVISWLGRYDADARISRGLNRYELIKDGELLETEFEELDLRYYAIDEFRALLAASGFEAIQAHRAYALEPPTPADESVVFECVKG